MFLVGVLLFAASYVSMAQQFSLGDSIKIRFVPISNEISYPSDLIVKIFLSNIAKSPIKVYSSISEGYIQDRFCNAYVEMQKRKNGKYSEYIMHSYSTHSSYKLDDSLAHYDLPKKSLDVYGVDTLNLDLLSLAGHFQEGYYKFRIRLRVQTIPNYTRVSDTTGSTYPAEDELKYVTSKWIYFHISKPVAKPITPQ